MKAMATCADWPPASDGAWADHSARNSLTAKRFRQVTGGSPGRRVPA